MLKGIGDLTYFASNEDDPYVTMKEEVCMLTRMGLPMFCSLKFNDHKILGYQYIY